MQLNLKLADKNKSQIIKLALSEILEGVVFSEAGIPITDALLPGGNFKIGELVDKISAAKNNKIMVGGIEINLTRKTASHKKIEVALTEIEVKIINFLHREKLSTREELLKKVWGYASDAATRTVETHIHRLNQKMQENFGMKLVENNKSGYKLV